MGECVYGQCVCERGLQQPQSCSPFHHPRLQSTSCRCPSSVRVKIGGHHAMLMVSHVKPPLLIPWSYQSPILLFDRCRSKLAIQMRSDESFEVAINHLDLVALLHIGLWAGRWGACVYLSVLAVDPPSLVLSCARLCISHGDHVRKG